MFVLRDNKADGRMREPIFLAYFTKAQRFVCIVNLHKRKQTFYHLWLYSWLEGVFASTVRRGGGGQVIAPAHHS